MPDPLPTTARPRVLSTGLNRFSRAASTSYADTASLDFALRTLRTLYILFKPQGFEPGDNDIPNTDNAIVSDAGTTIGLHTDPALRFFLDGLQKFVMRGQGTNDPAFYSNDTAATLGLATDPWAILYTEGIDTPSFLIGDDGFVSPPQITANQDNYSPFGLGKIYLVNRLSTDASRNITGLVAPTSSNIATIVNVGSFNIVLKDADTGSTEANRFALNGDITLEPDEGVTLIYDGTSDRWRCVGEYTAPVSTGPSFANVLAIASLRA